MLHRYLLTAALAIPAMASATPARAALIDVQFSGTFSFVCGYACPYFSPQQTGAAVLGTNGDQWNEFFASGASNQVLTDVGGAATSVLLSFSADGAYTAAANYDAFQGTTVAGLMQGYLVNNIAMTLTGLTPGQGYDLYLYTQGDNNSAGRAIGLSATGGTAATASQTNASTLIQNDNYVLLQPVADAFGDIAIGQYYVAGEANVNGFQLVATDAPEPGAISVLGVGLLALAGVTRRRLLVSHLGEGHQDLALLNCVPGSAADGRDDPIGGGRQAENGLHRFEDEQDLAADDGIPLSREHLGDLSWDRGNQAVGAIGFVVRARDRVGQAQAPGLAMTPDRAGFAVPRDRQVLAHAVERHRFVVSGPVEYI